MTIDEIKVLMDCPFVSVRGLALASQVSPHVLRRIADGSQATLKPHHHAKVSETVKKFHITIENA
jgi:RNA 3'-terminal phosphate cyclase